MTLRDMEVVLSSLKEAQRLQNFGILNEPIEILTREIEGAVKKQRHKKWRLTQGATLWWVSEAREEVIVPGYVSDEHPGIFIHREQIKDEIFGGWKPGKWYNITHTNSKLGLLFGNRCNIKTLSRAFEVFDEYLSGVNWDRSEEKVKNDPVAIEAVRSCYSALA